MNASWIVCILKLTAIEILYGLRASYSSVTEFKI